MKKDNEDTGHATACTDNRQRLILLGAVAFLLIAAIIVIPLCMTTLRPETVPVIETKADESLPSLIKVAPVGTAGGAILIEYTELLEDNSTVFYYLTAQDLNFTTFEGVSDPDNLALYLTSSAEPTGRDILRSNISVRLRHRRGLLSIDGENALRIGLVNSIEFPFRLPDSFLPGDFNGAVFIEENPEEDNAINNIVEIFSSASFSAIVDPERNIASTTSTTIENPQPTQSPTTKSSTNPTEAESSMLRSAAPTPNPSATQAPSNSPTGSPTGSPTPEPSMKPTSPPSFRPTTVPPSTFPTREPSPGPIVASNAKTSSRPTVAPSPNPTATPTISPQPTQTDFTPFPTVTPTFNPTNQPTLPPTTNPTSIPSTSPTKSPTTTPTDRPTELSSVPPTRLPTATPTAFPTNQPSTNSPSPRPTDIPTTTSTVSPTKTLVDPVSPQLPPILSSDVSGSYNLEASITIDYVHNFQNGAIVDVARLRLDIPNLANAPGPYLYLSKRPYSETRNGDLDDDDIFIPIDSGSDGQFNVKGRFDQFLDEIPNVQDLQDYANGSWVVWCRPFGVWIGGGEISAS